MRLAQTPKIIALLTALLLTTAILAEVTIPQSVTAMVDSSSASSSIEVLLSFENDLDLGAVRMSSLREKRTRIETYYDVMDRLEKNRQNLESSISPFLESMKNAGQIESYRFFTVSKTVFVRTRVDNVENLLTLPGVELINVNAEVTLINPVDTKDAADYSALTLANPGLSALNVPSLWAQGYTGAGSVVCSFDTGVDGDHPMLASKWRGNNGGPAINNWFGPRGDSLPYDNLGHGSHTMGVMVGSTGSDTIGVAPGAKWIAAAVVDQGANFATTIADILRAFDWALNPDGNLATTDDIPDVINNSWGVPITIYSDCNNTFWTAIDNVEAAGIVTIFAAGNEGPNPMTIRNPADRASSPLNAMSVGAIDYTSLVVADFSSRGPSDCSGAIKPEIVAPGVGIYSSYKDGTYKTMSGTSMAAPFISGLVALMRQYNPDATVEEIKNAFIQSARDLGPLGEDNAYGHGLVDASRLLQYLPAPTAPQVLVDSHQVNAGGDSFADPGETVDLTLTLNEPTNSISNVDVWLTTDSPMLLIVADTLRFAFVSDYAVSPTPFVLHVSPEAVSGSDIAVNVNISIPGSSAYDTRIIYILIGRETPGRIFTSIGGDIVLSASEFGQFGFGTGSIYQAGGEGFRFNGSDNLLYEGGLVMARNPYMVSDGIRNTAGSFKESDFIPANNNVINPVAASNETVTAVFTDGGAIVPIPVTVEQNVWTSDNNFAIIEYTIANPLPERLDNLAVGLFFDFDINRLQDNIGFDTLMGLLYQYDTAVNLYVGIVGMSAGEFAFQARSNGTAKRGLTTADKYAMVNTPGITIEEGTSADWYFTASQICGELDAFEQKTVAVALVAANSLNDLRQAAENALSEYGAYLDVEDVIASLPTEIELSQNYPNPFNPQTTIEFALKATQEVILDVFNVTGQKVITLLDGPAQAGLNSVIWDGRDTFGQQTASGIYLYRLTTEHGQSQTKKMILLK